YHSGLDAEIDELAHFRDALAIHDVEFDLLERRRKLVFDDLDARLIADDFVAILDGADAAGLETHGSLEFERIAAARGFRRAVHDADLHPDLIDEDHHRIGS